MGTGLKMVKINYKTGRFAILRNVERSRFILPTLVNYTALSIANGWTNASSIDEYMHSCDSTSVYFFYGVRHEYRLKLSWTYFVPITRKRENTSNFSTRSLSMNKKQKACGTHNSLCSCTKIY